MKMARSGRKLINTAKNKKNGAKANNRDADGDGGGGVPPGGGRRKPVKSLVP